MSAEQNKNLVRRVVDEVMNKGNLRIASAFLSPDFVNHDFPMSKPGPDEFAKILQTFFTGFPDMHVTVEDSHGEADKVFTRGYFTGTHKGAFQGIPPTGKKINVKYMDEWRINNGKATDNWVRIDMLSMMQQLGVVPQSPTPQH
jgi:steroid delta-isomerase-like uncharacterized protein